ncbi:MAG: ABC transporter substrate-binding protein, partial [Methanoregulaceae archaeon]|nr:ABC transporter substrate-binding protein [Methanoregulaceae archaeon]
MKKNAIGIFVAIMLLAVILGACSPKTTTPPSAATTIPTTAATSTTTKPVTTPATTTTAAQQYGGTLRIITVNSPQALGDPLQVRLFFGSIMAFIPCLESIIVFDNGGVPHGVLAESWTTAENKSSITFNLRKNVKFHDGTPFNAAAAKWNLDRMLSANVSTTATWSGIDVVDDYTIRINLKSYMNTILNGLEGTTGLMISPTAFKANGAEWAKTHAVGTGPYKLSSFVPDTSVDYVRFEDYWGGRPFLDGVKFIVIADATTAQMTFLAGQADVLASSSDANTADLASKGYKVETRPAASMVLLPDSIHPASPLSKLQVRQAISYSIDNTAIAKAFGYGYWIPATQLAAPQQFGYVPNLGYQPINIEKAKQLLTAAGYENGFTTKLITSSALANDPLVSIQNYLKAVNITATIETNSQAAWNDMAIKGWDSGMMWITLGATDTNYGSYLDRYFGALSIYY